MKSPVRRIHKVKTAKVVKDTYTDEALELMRDNCTNARDLAIIDLLASSGMRVGEMVMLNRDDIVSMSENALLSAKATRSALSTSMQGQKYIYRTTLTSAQMRTLHCLSR